MIYSHAEVVAILRKYNPWWREDRISHLPTWHRTAFDSVMEWVEHPTSNRALLLSGARQIGKTTLLLQAIEALLKKGVPATKILYLTFDHPLLKTMTLDQVLDIWKELEPEQHGLEYLFLDEIQYAQDWQVWLKHQVDFFKHRRLIVTGSAMPLVSEAQESGVGRWHTLQLPTLSFFEYLQLKNIALPKFSALSSLDELFHWKPRQFYDTTDKITPLIPHFHEYLMRGGFPQSAQIKNLNQAQQLLREDIVDKILKRDMTALFGVRHVLELEQLFLYLCLHDGALISIPELCKNLELKKPTVNNFISLLEAAHLIYRLPPFGYGKEILRARYKIYLADPAIAPSIMLQGKSLLEDPVKMSKAIETAFFKHALVYYKNKSSNFAYWRGQKDHEVDFIATVSGKTIPFEVKYREKSTGSGECQGLLEFCLEKKIKHAFVITKERRDFSLMKLEQGINIVKIPAVLACYWLSHCY